MDFNEIIEYIIKYVIKSCIDRKEWRDREGRLIIMRLVCKNKREFLINKQNYYKKKVTVLIKENKKLFVLNGKNALTSLEDLFEIRELSNYEKSYKLLLKKCKIKIMWLKKLLMLWYI